MQIWISDPRLLSDLIEFLHRASCRAVHTKGHTVEVEVPHAAGQAQAGRELNLYLAAWRGLHPGVSVDFPSRSKAADRPL
jgi:hypothetical protein